MSPDKILVIAGGIFTIGFIAWYFFGKKEETVIANHNMDIEVKGGYKPSKIQLKKGQKTILSFLRTDSNSCLEDVVIPDFRIKKFLPLNKEVSVELTPDKTGVFEISCGMNMFHGKIIVK